MDVVGTHPGCDRPGDRRRGQRLCRAGSARAARRATGSGRDHRALPDPRGDHPGRPGGPRCPWPRADRIGQDPCLRAADPHASARRRLRSGPASAEGLGPRADPGTGHAGLRRPRTARPRARDAAQARRRWAVLHDPDQRARAWYRPAHRHPRAAHRPARPRRRRTRLGSGRHPRRSRPHGRDGLPARGHPDPRRRPGRGSAAALLGDLGQRGRRGGPALPHRPGRPLDRRCGRLGDDDAPLPVPHRPAAQEAAHRRIGQPQRAHDRLRPHQARRRPGGRAVARSRCRRGGPARRTHPGCS